MYFTRSSPDTVISSISGSSLTFNDFFTDSFSASDKFAPYTTIGTPNFSSIAFGGVLSDANPVAGAITPNTNIVAVSILIHVFFKSCDPFR